MEQELLDVFTLETSEKKEYGVVIGTLIAFSDNGTPIVSYSAEPDTYSPMQNEAITTVDIHKNDINKKVTLLFERGDIHKPVITGIIRQPQNIQTTNGNEQNSQPITVESDGERIYFNAKKEIVLKCGKSSITLTRAGKIIVRGAYLLNRSSGTIKIQGGAVLIN